MCKSALLLWLGTYAALEDTVQIFGKSFSSHEKKKSPNFTPHSGPQHSVRTKSRLYLIARVRLGWVLKIWVRSSRAVSGQRQNGKGRWKLSPTGNPAVNSNRSWPRRVVHQQANKTAQWGKVTTLMSRTLQSHLFQAWHGSPAVRPGWLDASPGLGFPQESFLPFNPPASDTHLHPWTLSSQFLS